MRGHYLIKSSDPSRRNAAAYMKNFLNIFLRSGLCLDTVPVLRFCLRGFRIPLLRQLLIISRLKFSPDILPRIRAAGLPSRERGELFSAAMNLFRSGPTFKTTAAGRTPLTDAALLAKAGPGSLILETGVSDGISALGLLEARGGAGVILSDRQCAFSYRDFGPFRVFYDREDGVLSVKFLCFYLCTPFRSGGAPPGSSRVSLLNPAIEEKFPEARLLAFDIFSDSLPGRADLVKCANVLNKTYFPAAEARRALANLTLSLREGGWLFISQSNPKYEDGEAYAALRREGGRLILAEGLHGHELMPDLLSPLFADLVLPGGAA